MALVAGVDSSTQATKVVLRDIDSGRLVAAATSPHPATSPPLSEQDPAAWWSALAGCFGQLAEHAAHIRAISVGAQQHGLVLMSGSEVVRPAKLWNDLTSSEQSERLVAAAGADWWAAACGSVPVASFTITKLAWVLEHERELAAAVDRIMLPHDYLTWRLTGEHVTDRGDASGTGWFDPSGDQYRSELLGHAVDEPDAWLAKLPRVLRHDEPAGTVTLTVAAELGLGPGVVVGPGSGDNMAAALGLGLRPSDVAISIGTSGTVYATSDAPTSDSTGMIAGFADATGNFLPLVCTVNAAKVTDAAAGWLGVAPERLSELALAGIGEDLGPVLVPYFDGERTPNLPDATGYWAGLQSGTTREQLALSAFDGVVCGLLEGIDVLRAHGVDTGGRTFLIGGGSQSPAYRRRVADLAGRVIVVPHDKQLVASGAAAQAAAILAAEPVGETAQRWALGTGDAFEPDLPTGHRALRTRYRDARDRLFPAEPPLPAAPNP